jgi:hypothetical protein
MYRMQKNGNITSFLIWASVLMLISATAWMGVYIIAKQIIILITQ